MADKHSMLTKHERAVLVEWLDSIQLDQAAVLVEIGCFRGGTTIELAAWLCAAGAGKIYAIDPHRQYEGVYGGKFCQSDCNRFRENVTASGLDRYVEHLCTQSTDAAKHWERPIDCLFIDGDHSYQGVCADINAWVHHVRDGGIVVFDDWFEGSDVERAAIDCLGRSQTVPMSEYGKLRAFRVSHSASKPLFLAAGLQSGGTSLVSWCFLQRGDMDGILDLAHDVLTPIPEIRSCRAWAKATIASFTFDEIADYYRWQGWDVHPLLIVRDVRDVYSSLQHKWYGQNGTTAEDPPLRTRLLRFHATWRTFVERGWPVLCYERLTQDPEAELRTACKRLELDWDPAMLTWPKAAEQIAVGDGGNQTLIDSRGGHGLEEALIRRPVRNQWDDIAPGEMHWLREHYADMIEAFDYPSFPETDPAQVHPFATPAFDVTRRHAMEEEIRTLGEQLAMCRTGLLRLQRHPVLGPVIRAWARMVNPGLKQVFDDAEPRDG